MRILIIEDERKTAAYLQKGLSASGFVVDVAHDGIDGLHLAAEYNYDLIILDIHLPKLDGRAVLAGIRQINPRVRVLFLSGLDSVEDRVQGLELGADDYLVKPFAFSEVLARVKSLLRRSEVVESPTLSIADLNIDLIKHVASRNNQVLNLTPKEFALLTLLVQRSPEVLSRTMISEYVWGINFDCDTNVVDVTIRRLRKKVDEGFERQLIHTLRGVGYAVE